MATQAHTHAPQGEIQRYESAKLGQCSCGVDLVSHLAPIRAKYNWEEWEPTSLDDPCLECGTTNACKCWGE